MPAHRANFCKARTKMSVLTEAMMRLQGEIGGLRRARAVLQQDLSRQANERRSRVSALRAAFVRDRAGAHRAWFGPTLSERRTEERQQQQLAKETRAEVQREREQQRLAEEAKAEAQREQQPPATANCGRKGTIPLSLPRRRLRARPLRPWRRPTGRRVKNRRSSGPAAKRSVKRGAFRR
jgi:hypothetical protein